jgi:hypothetical protein
MFTNDNELMGGIVDYDVIWDFIPAPSSDSIMMLCYNALKQTIIHTSSLVNVPPNIILIDYGFQVSQISSHFVPFS